MQYIENYGQHIFQSSLPLDCTWDFVIRVSPLYHDDTVSSVSWSLSPARPHGSQNGDIQWLQVGREDRVMRNWQRTTPLCNHGVVYYRISFFITYKNRKFVELVSGKRVTWLWCTYSDFKFLSFDWLSMKVVPGKHFQAILRPKGNGPLYKANGSALLLVCFQYMELINTSTHFWQVWQNLVVAWTWLHVVLVPCYLINEFVAPSCSDSDTTGNLLLGPGTVSVHWRMGT